MGSQDIFKAFSATNGVGPPPVSGAFDAVRLSPYLSLVVAIIYMMMADGEISDVESSQLQSITRGDPEVLSLALRYVEQHSVDQFMQESADILDDTDRLCVLLNVCDSLMADGILASDELSLFDRLLTGYGHSKTSFRPYFEVMSTKNRTSVLGDFHAPIQEDSLSPPLAMVISLLYMMSSDGTMAEEEIGRLNVLVGNSPALLKAALRYVGKNKLQKFLASAVEALSMPQRHCVLLNVVDAMLADGEVATAESEILRRMLAAFGVAEKSFEASLHILLLKSDVPSGNPRQGRRSRPGLVFDRKAGWEETTGQPGQPSAGSSSPALPLQPVSAQGRELNAQISRTMRDNVDQLAAGIGDARTMARMERNSQVDPEVAIPSDLAGGDPKEGPHSLRALKDTDGLSKARRLSDAAGAAGGHATHGSGATAPAKHWKDAEGPTPASALGGTAAGEAAKHWRDADGPADAAGVRGQAAGVPAKHWRDADGPVDAAGVRGQSAGGAAKHWRDAGGPASPDAVHGHAAGVAAKHWRDASGSVASASPGDPEPAFRLQEIRDDRNAFDRISPGDQDQVLDVDEILGRMASTRQRTHAIHVCIDAMVARKPLPRLPAMSPSGNALARRAEIRGRSVSAATAATTEVLLISDTDSDPWLIAFDHHESSAMTTITGTPPQSASEITSLHQSLRRWSLVLFPTLIVAQGLTSMGESIAEQSYIRHDTQAISSHAIHQMASVQQTIYQIAPDAVTLSKDNTVSAESGTPAEQASKAFSGREEAIGFLEGEKGKLTELLSANRVLSKLSTERLQWFMVAKSILMLGLGMTIWGVFFRSRSMLYGASVASIAGVLFSLNGFSLFFRL